MEKVVQEGKMRTKKVLITGCGGMLGSAIYPYFLLRYKHVVATDKVADEDWLTELDVRDYDSLSYMFRDFRPDIVLHLAAETSLEYCETHKDTAVDTNASATETIGRLCNEYGATHVYISTAGVFNGTKTEFYTEEDRPDPIMVYGQTKYDGEIHALKTCPRTFVVRAGWMMGGGRRKEKKFIYKILQQIKDNKPEIFAVDDLWGTPTYTLDFARNLDKLMESKEYGLYHMVCEGKGTRYSVAEEILRICNRSDIPLTPVGSDYFKEEYFVERPKSEMMINKNLTRLGLNLMRPWDKALKNYIESYFLDYIKNPAPEEFKKRKHIRRNHKGEIRIRINGDETVCKLIDVSISGAGFIIDRDLDIGQTISVNNQLAEKAPWQESEVKYALETGKGYHVGIKFPFENPYAALHLLDK